MKVCLLCEAPADSREHYFPNWLSSACDAKEMGMSQGHAVRGQITEMKPVGILANAKAWLLCRKCNSSLGDKLESPVFNVLAPYVSKTVELGQFSVSDKEMLAKWMILRALEVSAVLKQSLLDRGIREPLIEICRSARDGRKLLLWPGSFMPSLEAVRMKTRTVHVALSSSFYSSERGEVKSATSGFWFFLQMNRLGLLLINSPSSQRNNSQGYGLRLFPEGVATVNQRGLRTDSLHAYDDVHAISEKLTLINTEN